MKKYWSLLAVVPLAFSVVAHASEFIDFTTFVPSAPITAATGSDATIAFTYAGNKFVGTTYHVNQLYSTDLNGANVTAFGTPLPGGDPGELVLGASLGQSGFANGNVFAGAESNNLIYQYANSGGAPSLFATLPAGSGDIRQILFDPGSTFGGNMIVSTDNGHIYTISSSGVVSLLINVGEDTEGMDIAPSTWGPYAGYLMVGSEGSGTLRVISPLGVVATTITGLPGAETVSSIPLALDGSNPLEGFYVANYATNIQFAAAQQFVDQGLLGTTIVTDETGGSTAWDIAYNGAGFSVTQFSFNGNPISQFEDGIFVTPQRITDTGGGTTPEPSSIVLLGTGLLGLGGALKRKFLS